MTTKFDTWHWHELTADELAIDAAEAKRARRAARQRRLARKGAIESVLPPGLWRGPDNALMFACRVCKRATEWPAEIEDFDINHRANVCGGSPWCCP